MQHGDCSTAKNFAQDHGPAWDRGHEDALQEPFLAVFDDGDGGEDGGEEQDHDQRAGEEMGIAEAVALHFRTAEAGAEQQPEDDRLAERAEHAVALAQKADQLALRERTDDRPGWDSRTHVASRLSI